MKSVIAIATCVVIGMSGAFLCSTAARADSAATMPQVSTTMPYWQEAQALAIATQADLRKGGIVAIQAHVPDLEQSLAHADRSFASAQSGNDAIYVLTDGQAEAAMAAANSARIPGAAGRKVVAVGNPYPILILLLASYYNEVRKSADALRVLDAGLALPTAVPGVAMGATLPALVTERGVALNALKRWPEALAAYDGGLTIANLKDTDRGRMLRGRGFALTELGRLDEAEKSYRDSLISDPNNALALRELNYIANIRSGRSPAPAILIAPGVSKPQPQP
jgi:tetratricopeptide (TPR) repeat protein